jgi:hypothetical protein
MTHSTGLLFHVFFGGLHALGALIFGVGLLLMLFWAFKHLPAEQLKSWGRNLLVVGFVLCLVSLLGGIGMRKGVMGRGGMMHKGMMDKGGMMRMSMDDMTMSLDGKTGDDFDKAFIQAMIPHHQGAIDMAKAAQTSAKHAEIKRMADAIISAQQREIGQMNQWMKSWGY